MKTKALLLVCLFVGIGLTQVSAQKGQDGTTGSYSERFSSVFAFPVFCDGQQVDYLEGNLEWHHIGKWLKGNWQNCYVQLFGELTSSTGSGEVFRVKLIGKQDNNIQSNGDWNYFAITHVNLIGDKGSHYIGEFTMDYTGKFVSIRSVCPGVK
jgi:hypothetical protein